jgi:hypothetical protein
MSIKSWETIEIRYCNHAGCEAALEAELVYPAEWLPGQEARVLSHRCSHAADCMVSMQSACQWSGGMPVYDPYLEKA